MASDRKDVCRGPRERCPYALKHGVYNSVARERDLLRDSVALALKELEEVERYFVIGSGVDPDVALRKAIYHLTIGSV